MSESISKWVKAHQKNTSKKWINDKSFSNQKIQNIVTNIFQNKANQKEYSSTTKYACASTKKKEII